MDDKHAKYQKAGLGRRIGCGERPAILIVDFNKGCTAKDSPLSVSFGPPLMDLDDQVACTRTLIDLARKSGTLIIYTTVGPLRADMQDIGPLGFKQPGLRIYIGASKWAEIDDRLEVRPEDFVIWKKWQSAFAGTDLANILVYQRIDTLVVTGCVTSGCVRATVVDACTHGYRVIIPQECVGDRTADVHEASLFDMNAKNADVVPVAEAEAYFHKAAAAAHPELRTQRA